jgi:hypothetical protein
MRACAIAIAALLLATGTAHATEHFLVRCAGQLFTIYGHHGYSFCRYPCPEGPELPERLFRFRDKPLDVSPYTHRTWFYRGHKCKIVDDFLAPKDSK